MDSLKTEMEETKNRFFAFVEKLEARMKEFAEASLPELVELNTSDTSNNRQNFQRMQSAVKGQLDSIRQKANEVLNEKIDHFQSATNSNEGFYDFRNECQNRLEKLEKLHHSYLNQIKATDYEDYEIAYQKIKDEYSEIQNKFKCVQCSSPILIDKMYFTTTYITCPSCQTQNTYEPSSLAKQLEHLGRSLAEQRTAHMLVEYNKAPEKEQKLYLQMHDLKISLIHEKDKQIIAQKTAQIEDFKKQKQSIADSRPILYQKYLRAMFDEWNAINPAMNAEHEKFYIRLLEDNKR